MGCRELDAIHTPHTPGRPPPIRMASRPVKTLPGPLPIPPHLTGDVVKWEQAISRWGHACNNGVNGGDCCGETMCEDHTCDPPHGLFQCACGFTYCGCCYARSPSDGVIRVGHAATRRHPDRNQWEYWCATCNEMPQATGVTMAAHVGYEETSSEATTDEEAVAQACRGRGGSKEEEDDREEEAVVPWGPLSDDAGPPVSVLGAAGKGGGEGGSDLVVGATGEESTVPLGGATVAGVITTVTTTDSTTMRRKRQRAHGAQAKRGTTPPHAAPRCLAVHANGWRYALPVEAVQETRIKAKLAGAPLLQTLASMFRRQRGKQPIEEASVYWQEQIAAARVELWRAPPPVSRKEFEDNAR